MAKPYAPIILISRKENKVGAFFTISEALGHANDRHSKLAPGDEWEYFDAKGRSLSPVLVPGEKKVDDLVVDGTPAQKAAIRSRVGIRAKFVESKLAQHPKPEDAPRDSSVLRLPFGKTPSFEVFAWKLAEVLRHDGSPADPANHGEDDKRGFWHNTFSH